MVVVSRPRLSRRCSVPAAVLNLWMMMIIILPILLLLLLIIIVSSSCVDGKLLLPTFISSHMVLQREPYKAKIWGWATNKSNVTLELLSLQQQRSTIYVDHEDKMIDQKEGDDVHDDDSQERRLVFSCRSWHAGFVVLLHQICQTKCLSGTGE